MNVLPGIFESSIGFHRDLLTRLEKERAEIDSRISEVRDHITRLELEAKKTSRLPNRNGAIRRRKGENARAIADLFTDDMIALTKQEIADKAGVPFTSVIRVLEKAGD